MNKSFLKNIKELLNNKQGDSHLHTNWTDGLNSIEEMIKSSNKIDLKWIIFSEHNRENSEYSYKSFAEEIKEKSCIYSNIKLISGAECKIKSFKGDIDISAEASSYADVVTGVVHRFPGEKGNIIKSKGNKYTNDELDYALKTERDLMMAGIENKAFLILGHPFGMTIRRFGLVPNICDFDEIIFACKKNNIIFELNLRYHYPIIGNLIDSLEKNKVIWTIGSNSHSSNELIFSWKKFRENRFNLI